MLGVAPVEPASRASGAPLSTPNELLGPEKPDTFPMLSVARPQIRYESAPALVRLSARPCGLPTAAPLQATMSTGSSTTSSLATPVPASDDVTSLLRRSYAALIQS